MLLASVSYGLLKALAALFFCQLAVLLAVLGYKKYVSHKAARPKRLRKLLASHNV